MPPAPPTAPTPLPDRPIEILLVEDFEPDVMLAQLALEDSPLPCHVQLAWDGLDALNLMHRQPPFEHSPRPDLILLDLHLPRMDGLSLLDALQTEPGLRAIPVVVLTTSPADLGLLGGRQDWVRLYLQKPLSAARVTEVFQALFGLSAPSPAARPSPES